MGQQLSITKDVMISAGWMPEDVQTQEGYWDTSASDNYGKEPEWVPPQYVRVWKHPKHGKIAAYAVSSGDFFVDCNPWGSNRSMCGAMGLFELPHSLG